MMSNYRFKYLLTIIFTSTFIFFSASVKAQNEDTEFQQDTTTTVVEGETEDSESASIWELIGQAGNIRFPIYGILIVGVFLISMRSYEFYIDSKMSEELEEVSFRHMSLNEISSKVSSQPDYMLSRIMAKLLNVFETNRNADYLHDEIANYNSVRQDSFNTFKNRIDFLSDTAGALGLLGTVWGMFTVFYSGTLEKEVILAGMGIALMSTLLGLVVSIILNFCSTLTEGFFAKHLEKVTSKADELRFRLIELSENSQETLKTSVEASNNSTRSKSDTNNEKVKRNPTPVSSKEETKSKKENEPAKVTLKSALDDVQVDETIKNINVELQGTLGKPVSSAYIDIILDGKGEINNQKNKASVKTNADGIAKFNWKVDKKIGEKRILIRCADKEFKDIKTVLNIEAVSGEPDSLKLLNNHQAGLIGKQLNKPVSIVVVDQYENPVSSVKVVLKVSMGDGKFSNNKREIISSTNKEGKVHADFTLGDEPGFNAVDISLPEHNITKSFQAVGQEVTV